MQGSGQEGTDRHKVEELGERRCEGLGGRVRSAHTPLNADAHRVGVLLEALEDLGDGGGGKGRKEGKGPGQTEDKGAMRW